MAAARTPKCDRHIGFSFKPVTGEECQKQPFDLTNNIFIGRVFLNEARDARVEASQRP
jgi:hypothetical protein